MHVPWGWVKQRPHFIAEHLAEHFDVTVCHTEVFNRKLLADNPLPAGCKLEILPMLRMAHFEPVRSINNWRLSRILKKLLEQNQYDIVWIPHPDTFSLVEPGLTSNMRVVCDCMDDYLEFPDVSKDQMKRERLLRLESRMLERADLIFASSERLRGILKARHNLRKEIHVVNNAISIESRPSALACKDELTRLKQKGLFLASYIGTIAEWLDTGLMLEVLDKFPDLAFLLFGPVETPVPAHDRIITFGPIPHSQVYSAMAASDLLVMPFRVTPLVQSVNPVKLYEYIYSGKPTLAVAYGESEAFADYVYLYRDKEEFIQLLEDILGGKSAPIPTADECRSFAEANTWGARVHLILQYV